MEDKKQRNSAKCPSFEFCGAEVIRELRGENWRQRFCFAGYKKYKKCDHYQIRKINRKKQ